MSAVDDHATRSREVVVYCRFSREILISVRDAFLFRPIFVSERTRIVKRVIESTLICTNIFTRVIY